MKVVKNGLWGEEVKAKSTLTVESIEAALYDTQRNTERQFMFYTSEQRRNALNEAILAEANRRSESSEDEFAPEALIPRYVIGVDPYEEPIDRQLEERVQEFRRRPLQSTPESTRMDIIDFYTEEPNIQSYRMGAITPLAILDSQLRTGQITTVEYLDKLSEIE